MLSLAVASCAADDVADVEALDSATETDGSSLDGSGADAGAAETSDASGEVAAETSVADAADTSVADGSVGDTSVADTGAADAAVPDGADASPAESSVLDAMDATSTDSADAGAADAGGRAHIVEASAARYAESAEATNGTTAGAEPTGYSLDSSGGVFSGVFEPTTPTTDCYQFQTGSTTHVDVQVFFGGYGLTGTPGSVYVSIDAVAFDGLSSLFGLDYVNRATVTAGALFRVCLTPYGGRGAGESYTVEVRASP